MVTRRTSFLQDIPMSKTKLNLLIVEDDQILASSLKLLAPDLFKVYLAQKPSLVPDHVFFHAALVDMHLEVTPGQVADGPAVIKSLAEKNPQIEAVAMSGHLDRELMEKAIKAGAQRFLAKPLLTEEVQMVLGKIEAIWSLRLVQSEKSLSLQFIGSSPATETLRKQIAELKQEKKPVLIEGETGTGKEVIAQLLHQQEGVRPFVSVNCSALTETLFESEFFGHVKGSFTGADNNKIGLAEAAHGGDLFLDEIEALPLSQQAKLLRFLESGEIRRVGAKETQHVQVRIIAASNIPLKKLIEEKKFREDLYFRLSSHLLQLPPLRDRKEDIPELANYFVALERPRRNKTFEASAFDALKQYTWPGNVRELKRVCEQLCLTAPLPIIRKEDVEKLLFGHSETTLVSYDSNEGLPSFLIRQEKQFIENCLQKTSSLEEACEKLQISKSSLYKKIKDLGIST